MGPELRSDGGSVGRSTEREPAREAREVSRRCLGPDAAEADDPHQDEEAEPNDAEHAKGGEEGHAAPPHPDLHPEGPDLRQGGGGAGGGGAGGGEGGVGKGGGATAAVRVAANCEGGGEMPCGAAMRRAVSEWRGARGSVEGAAAAAARGGGGEGSDGEEEESEEDGSDKRPHARLDHAHPQRACSQPGECEALRVFTGHSPGRQRLGAPSSSSPVSR